MSVHVAKNIKNTVVGWLMETTIVKRFGIHFLSYVSYQLAVSQAQWLHWN